MTEVHETSAQARSAAWDHLAEELQSLRSAVGDPSYGEIARRIAEQRVADGEAPHAARVARTTVYDAFRTGRARVNVGLVREIVRALGRDPGVVDQWIARARAAATELDPTEAPRAPLSRPTSSQVVLLMLACIALNLLGRLLVDVLHLSVFLDMVGTAVAAIVLGPWLGAVVGASTNVLGIVESGPMSAPFAAVNVAGALVWGYGVHRYGMGRTLPRFFVLNVLAALVCSLVAVPIVVLVYGGATGHGQDGLAQTLLAFNRTLLVAVGLSNVLVSLADKLISGFVALVVGSLLPWSMRARVPLVLLSPTGPSATDHEPRPTEPSTTPTGWWGLRGDRVRRSGPGPADREEPPPSAGSAPPSP